MNGSNGISGLLNTSWARDAVASGVSSSPSSSASASGSGTAAASGSGVSFLSQGNFFQLLTAQLSHQNPLAPMSSTQFMSELAQLSTATGMQSLGQTVGNLQSGIGTSTRLRATSLIGRYIGVSGNEITLSNSGSASAAYSLPSSAQSVKVTIQNAQGATVAQLNLGPMSAGTHQFQWPGSGQAPGDYTFSVQASNASGQPLSAQTLSLKKIASVQLGSSGINLAFANGSGTMPFSQVTNVF